MELDERVLAETKKSCIELIKNNHSSKINDLLSLYRNQAHSNELYSLGKINNIVQKYCSDIIYDSFIIDKYEQNKNNIDRLACDFVNQIHSLLEEKSKLEICYYNHKINSVKNKKMCEDYLNSYLKYYRYEYLYNLDHSDLQIIYNYLNDHIDTTEPTSYALTYMAIIDIINQKYDESLIKLNEAMHQDGHAAYIKYACIKSKIFDLGNEEMLDALSFAVNLNNYKALCETAYMYYFDAKIKSISKSQSYFERCLRIKETGDTLHMLGCIKNDYGLINRAAELGFPDAQIMMLEQCYNTKLRLEYSIDNPSCIPDSLGLFMFYVMTFGIGYIIHKCLYESCHSCRPARAYREKLTKLKTYYFLNNDGNIQYQEICKLLEKPINTKSYNNYNMLSFSYVLTVLYNKLINNVCCKDEYLYKSLNTILQYNKVALFQHILVKSYELMKFVKNRIKNLKKEISHLDYQPGGPGYIEAQGHFNTLSKKPIC